jgi:hypothetical protein
MEETELIYKVDFISHFSLSLSLVLSYKPLLRSEIKEKATSSDPRRYPNCTRRIGLLLLIGTSLDSFSSYVILCELNCGGK